MRRFKVFVRVLIFTCLLAGGGIFYPFSTHAIFMDDFLVNDTINGDYEIYPRIACDSAGNFVCIWVDVEGEYFRLFIKGYDSQGNVRFGPKVMPTDSMKARSRPAVYMRPGGDFVVACSDWWTGGTAKIHVQRYDKNGNDAGDRLSFFFIDSSGTTVSGSFVRDVAMDSSGRIIVTGEQAGDGRGFAQVFGVDNQPIGPSFRLNVGDTTGTKYEGRNSNLAIFRDGKFVIAFDAFTNGVLQPLANIYSPQVTPLRSCILLSCDTIPVFPECDGIPSGCNGGVWPVVSVVNEQKFMEAYNACGDWEWNYVYVRVFDTLGDAVTSNRRINNIKANNYDLYPEISCDGQGNCVVFWFDSRNSYFEGPLDLFVQRLDSLANPIGANHRVNTVLGSPHFAVIDVATNGKQVNTIWVDTRIVPPFGRFNIFAQVMDLEKVGVFTPGDITLDDKVNIEDLITLINYVFKGGKIPVSERWISDVTGDCKVNLADVIYLVNYVFKGGALPKTGCAS